MDSQHDEVALGEGDEVSAEEGEVVLGAGEDDEIQYLENGNVSAAHVLMDEDEIWI